MKISIKQPNFHEPKLRQAFKKKNTKTIFTSGSNSADTRQKLLPNSYPGIDELKCTCNST